MAGLTEKLYPPVISGSLPAFYSDGGTARIAVPFSMNRAVSQDNIKCFRIKIKTVQSNTLIKDLRSTNDPKTMIANRIAYFDWTDINSNSQLRKIKIGQFLKVQMAYVDYNDNTGYYSTVGIIKYTAKPNVFIEGLGNDVNKLEAFRSTYVGVYEPGEDKSERPYSYKFSLYDNNNGLVETSGWLLHNTSINNVASESLTLDRTTDTYTFDYTVNVDSVYYLQYSVRTINNLEINSSKYTCVEPYIRPSELDTDLHAENIFEEGYIKVFLTVKNKDAELNNPVSIEISRSEKTDNFSSWRAMQRIYFSDYDAVRDWEFRDFTIEQGITYKYCFRQYNSQGMQSERTVSNEVMADFEDMFLWDGNKQLKIRFNPKVSSFKTNRLEQKTDTIGSRYPFIFRNGKVEYKEFPISGLISYLADNNELFVNHQEDLNIILGSQTSRGGKTPVDQKVNDTVLGKSWETSQTLDSLGYNMQAERRFKLKLMDWLGDGQIKLFRSPAEGNYLVRILNVSLTPEDRVGRMIHSFNCTAYEVEEFTYNNLLNLGFLTPEDTIGVKISTKSLLLKDWIRENIQKEEDLNKPIKINNENVIFEYLNVDMASGLNQENQFYLRMGAGDNSKTLILPYKGGFTLESKGNTLPDVYFCASDNYDFIDKNQSVAQIKNSLISLIGDTVLTYRYYSTSKKIGELYNIKNVYLTNVIQTINGPITAYFNNTDTREILKFFVLNFKEKPIREIEAIVDSDANAIEYKDKDGNILTQFDDLFLYKIKSGNQEYYYAAKDGQLDYNSYKDGAEGADTAVTIITTEGKEFSFETVPPIVNLMQLQCEEVRLGAGVYLECAYQEKITEYND